jgi:hypothetical protein
MNSMVRYCQSCRADQQIIISAVKKQRNLRNFVIVLGSVDALAQLLRRGATTDLEPRPLRGAAPEEAELVKMSGHIPGSSVIDDIR